MHRAISIVSRGFRGVQERGRRQQGDSSCGEYLRIEEERRGRDCTDGMYEYPATDADAEGGLEDGVDEEDEGGGLVVFLQPGTCPSIYFNEPLYHSFRKSAAAPCQPYCSVVQISSHVTSIYTRIWKVPSARHSRNPASPIRHVISMAAQIHQATLHCLPKP